ncbi:hypothetical protein SEA_MAGRITTE_187 [Microbacterium phage Magritte]|nr:hypothetical protein SEA_MAGRITTE_187 [Microbacterium phage Magritte]
MNDQIPDDASALEELRAKLYDEPVEPGLLWEDEGITHRAALTAHGDDAVLWVARIKNMAGHTVYLPPAKRRALAAALLKDLPEDDDD